MGIRDVPAQLRRQVIERAQERCEYCHMPDRLSFYSPEIDHIVARKHGGVTVLDNLALACWRCNHNKGSDLSSFDPLSGELTRLFTPRTDVWEDHFRIEGSHLVSDTPSGRTTISLLRLNESERLTERTLAIGLGQYS